MDKSISLKDAFDAINSLTYPSSLNDVKWKLIELPSVELKTGKWIRDGHHIKCDQCGMHMCDTDREGDKIPNNFCPNCGSYNGGKINDQ